MSFVPENECVAARRFHKWSQAESEHLIEIWNDPGRIADLAARLNRTVDGVSRKAIRLGLTKERTRKPRGRKYVRPKKGRPPTFWDNPENNQTLLSLFSEGLSCSKIALEMGRSKGAIIGRLARLKLTGTRTRAKTKKKSVEANHWRDRKRTVREKPDRIFEILPDPDPTDCIPFLFTKPGQCRWLFDGSLCCGRDTVPGRSWCESHYKRVFCRR